MRVFEYNPKVIKRAEGGEYENPFEGTIKIEVPTYKERLTLMKEMNFNTSDAGIDDGIKLYELVAKLIQEVDLIHKHSEEIISDLDTLGYFKEGSDLINALGQVVIGGFVAETAKKS